MTVDHAAIKAGFDFRRRLESRGSLRMLKVRGLLGDGDRRREKG
jgi:hypothetical protein